MHIPRRRRFLRGAAAVLALGAAPFARGQAFPSKPVRIVVPFPPAGLNDVVARNLATRLSERWGQPVVVENRPGGGTIIGSELVAKAAPDGYTLLLTSVAHAINPSVYKSMPYDIQKSFAPIALVAASPFLLVIRPTLPARTVAEFVAFARTQPGRLTYSSTGAGGSSHLMGEMLKAQAGIDIVHVPYKGMAPALTDLMGGQVDFTFGSWSSVGPHVRAGKMRALAVTSRKRLAVLPDVPTIAESGYPAYESTPWWGLAAPAGTPAPVIAKLNTDIGEAMKNAELQALFRETGIEVLSGTPADYARFLDAEVAHWAKVVRESNVKLD
jgi:tripartite-type tricarboxylate transporter receptor subunit TctC